MSNFRIVRMDDRVWPELAIPLPTLALDELWDLVIEKWELVVQMCRDYSEYWLSCGGTDSCAFCLVYGGDGDSCGECPIALAGYPGCRNPTFRAWTRERGEPGAQRQLDWLRLLRQKEAQ